MYDLGCGVGSNLAVLSSFGRTEGFDGSELAVSAAHRLGRSSVRLADLSRGVAELERLGCAPGCASLVLYADVLEHLADEQPALEIAEWLLAPGGALVVTVPAFPQLWSASDEFNHHHRRYTRDTMRAAIGDRFEIERMSYFNSLLFAPIAAARAISRRLGVAGEQEIKLPSAPVNRALAWLFSSEARLLAHADLPVGVSLLCVARRRSTRS